MRWTVRKSAVEGRKKSHTQEKKEKKEKKETKEKKEKKEKKGKKRKKQMDGHTDWRTHGLINRWTDGQMDWWTDWQTDEGFKKFSVSWVSQAFYSKYACTLKILKMKNKMGHFQTH